MTHAALAELTKLCQKNKRMRAAVQAVCAEFEAVAHAKAKREQELEQRLAEQEHDARDLRNSRETLKDENEHLKHVIAKLQRVLFGRRSEEFRTEEENGQGHLFSEEDIVLLEDALGVDLGQVEPDLPEPSEMPRRRGGRRPLPGNLEVEVREITLPSAARVCPGCDVVMESIGTEEKKTLEYIPAKTKIIHEVRHKYGCRHCHGGGIISAPPRPRPVPKGLAEPSLLAHVAVSKFANHLPLYRQSVMFRRDGIDLSDSTLCEWICETADVLAPVVEELKKELLLTEYLQADETTLKVLAKGGCKTGQLWALGRPRGAVIYHFRMDRSRDGPLEYLKGFRGKLQVDGYEGYGEAIRRYELTEFACMAHARRYFFDAQTTAPSRATRVLAEFQKLYHIEKLARTTHLSTAQRTELRQREAKPIFDRLSTLIDEFTDATLPKSPLGEALTYFRNRRTILARYLEHGDVEIDNNLIENGMRGVAVGRKNYLFAGSKEGGRRAAVLYSLIETCKRLGINPYDYLKDVLERICTQPADRVYELTPTAWIQARQQAASAT